ncbi:MAG TPA: hypothetical protein VFU02_16730 [Polyangiaceae bacterium]|nr:hypothetical protein [Polyangiaceae bacterium]
MLRTTLLIVLSMLTGCGASSEPLNTSEPPRAASPPPSGKRGACTVGADQTCNEDPRVSSLWGRCTELGTCECKPGFEVGPSGYCRPLQK